MRQIVLDTETTGLSPKYNHRITEIGCLELIDRKVTGRTFQTYLNPERELDLRAAEITGLTWSFLKDKPKFSSVVDKFLDFIRGAQLIIHNAPFDLGFLDHELGLLAHPFGSVTANCLCIDTLALAKQLHPGQRNNLDALCKRYNIDNAHRNYHGALLDAEILALVYLRMTAGQTSLELGGEAKNINYGQSFTAKNYVADDLSIIFASDSELAAHDKIIETLTR
jgi:DNA polymerase-3 subunit epsilon